jgi:hypothetical protein
LLRILLINKNGVIGWSLVAFFKNIHIIALIQNVFANLAIAPVLIQALDTADINALGQLLIAESLNRRIDIIYIT